MRPGALPDLNTFLLVAEHLSFRAAAERLELTAPAVSHAIRHLEGRPGVRLLNRMTRSVSLTHAGIRLVDRQRPAFDQISGAIEELNEERRRPVGRLRIWASPMATTIVVTTIWQRYLSTYPDVQLEVWIDVGRVEVVMRAAALPAAIWAAASAALTSVAALVAPASLAALAAPVSAGRPSAPPSLVQILEQHAATSITTEASADTLTTTGVSSADLATGRAGTTAPMRMTGATATRITATTATPTIRMAVTRTDIGCIS